MPTSRARRRRASSATRGCRRARWWRGRSPGSSSGAWLPRSGRGASPSTGRRESPREGCLAAANRHNADPVRVSRRLVAFLAALVMASAPAHAGAPRDGDVFVNAAGSRPWPGPQVTLPFFARKAWTSLVGRDGGAPHVPYDRAAMLENPSLTWIGHSTLLVRMDVVTFLTDPIFSERASPVSFAGPKRLGPPGVPPPEPPPTHFVTPPADHSTPTHLPSTEA